MISVVSRRLAPIVVSAAVLGAACGSGATSTEPVSATSTSVSPSPNSASPWPTDPTMLDGVAAWTIEVVGSISHDPSLYLQGLELFGGVLYESSGLYDESSIRSIDLASGDEIARVDLGGQYFGEGLTVTSGELLQLTWREGTVFRRDLVSLETIGQWSYEGEGWGICLSGDELVMSDGSAHLTWRDPDDFSVIRTVDVVIDGQPVELINELECIGSLAIANIYTTTDLIVMDPSTGEVLAVVDASLLLDLVAGRIGDDSGNVLNGVADLGDGTLLLGGKRWPEMYQVRLISR